MWNAKISNLNCEEMGCNDVKYFPEKDADSYYSRGHRTEPILLIRPRKMLTRQFHCQSVTNARVFSCFFFRHALLLWILYFSDSLFPPYSPVPPVPSTFVSRSIYSPYRQQHLVKGWKVETTDSEIWYPLK